MPSGSLIRYLLGGLAIAMFLVVVIWFGMGISAAQYEEEGKAALARQDRPAAIQAFEHAVRISPEMASAWKLLADACSQDGRVDRAQEALETLARLSPNDAGTLGLVIGGRWMAKNQVRPAVRALRVSTVATPNAPEGFRLLAQIYSVLGQRREVVQCLMALLQQKAFTAEDLIVLSSVNPSVDDPERLKLIIAADPENKSALLPLAMKELDQNHVEEAQRILSEIIAFDPEDHEAQGILGELYADFQPEKFLDWHARLSPTAENDSRIWLARGKWLNAIGESSSAIRCLHESVSREPSNVVAVTLLGQLLKSQGEIELGSGYTEYGRRLQKITDLNQRLNEPRGREYVEPMVEELEAAGRLWEAYAWCVTYEQNLAESKEVLRATQLRIQMQLRIDLPRTKPSVVPGYRVDWQRFPLPDWKQLKSRDVKAVPTTQLPPSTIRFEDRTALAQLDFRYVNTAAQESGHKIYETMGAGVAVLDYDQDGWPDLYFPQGKPLPLESADGPSDALYRNQHGERYSAVTATTGIHETTYSHGAAIGDFDNDGFPDIYVANMGRNTLFHNLGDGTFANVTDKAGLQQQVWTISCAIADLNGDGLPELFDVNYVQGKELLTATCLDPHRRPVVCRPTVFDPVLDTVSLNLGDGRFQEVQEIAGLDLPQGMGLGLVIADYNDDQRLDVFVANDMTANYLLINEAAGPDQPLRFRDEAFLRGVALDANGLAQACMGVACADVNRDGRPDLLVTNFAKESNTLYLSVPGGLYQDLTQRAGLREPSFEPLGFGTQFLDADRDGWFDLVVANGHIDEFVDEPYRMKLQLFRGEPDGRFTELLAPQAGSLLDELRLARGLARVDWNRDGRVDFVTTDLEKPPLLAENVTESPNHALRLKLVGTQSNRDAIGAKVRVIVDSADERVCQVTAGDGYESSNERIVDLGVGHIENVSRIEIGWPSGATSRFESVSCQDTWLAIEGRSALVSMSPQ